MVILPQKVKPNNHGDIESNFDVWSGGISCLFCLENSSLITTVI